MICIMAGALSTHSVGQGTVYSIHQEEFVLMMRWSHARIVLVRNNCARTVTLFVLQKQEFFLTQIETVVQAKVSSCAAALLFARCILSETARLRAEGVESVWREAASSLAVKASRDTF